MIYTEYKKIEEDLITNLKACFKTIFLTVYISLLFKFSTTPIRNVLITLVKY